MSQVLINESTLQDIADTIRNIEVKTSKTVLGYEYSNTGTYSKYFTFSDFFPNFTCPYFCLKNYYSSFSGALIVKDYNNRSIPFNTYDTTICQGTNHPSVSKSGPSYSWTMRFRILPLDSNFNYIIYDPVEHGNLPHLTITDYFPSTELYYPSDFAENIKSGNRIYQIKSEFGSVAAYTDTYLSDPTTYASHIPGTNLKFFGVNKIEDIKLLAGYDYSWGPFLFCPGLQTGANEVQGFGLGYDIYFPRSNYDYWSTGSYKLYYKDGRLYMNGLDSNILPSTSNGQQAILVV